jgi:hypothetical protein
MAEQVRRAWTAWKRLPFARKIRLFGYAVLLIAAVELVIVSSVYDQLLPFWQGFLINLGTDALGVAITVLVLNALQERAQEEQLKKQLIREMRSSIKDVAVPASEEVAARGWLYDGSLARASLYRANLAGADLGAANLAGADLRVANLAGADLRETNLAGADLLAANLARADLLAVNLAGARLWSANLTGAKLLAAELYGADLERANLAGAVYNVHTKWPDGFDPKAAGAINMDEQAKPPAGTQEPGDG